MGSMPLHIFVEQLIHPLQAQFHELTPMGSARLGIAADDFIEELDSLLEVPLLEDLLAGIGTIWFGIEEPPWQYIVFDGKSLATVEGPGHDGGALGRLHQFEEARIPPRNGVQKQLRKPGIYPFGWTSFGVTLGSPGIYTFSWTSFGVTLTHSGVPIEIVSKVILRHVNLSTTQRYLGTVSDVEAMRWIDNLYG